MELTKCKQCGKSESSEIMEKIELCRLCFYTECAKDGNVEAMANVAIMYNEGLYAPQDYAKAAEWFLKAAEQGDTDSQYALAQSYHRGEGVPRDTEQAAFWYKKAAEQGHAEAQHMLTIFLDDKVQEAIWNKKAAEQGHAEAQYSLGQAYEFGWGVPRDEEQAALWYKKAADQGHEDAKDALFEMNLNENLLCPHCLGKLQDLKKCTNCGKVPTISMEIPVISVDTLADLGNQVERGFDNYYREKAQKATKKGIYTMETLLDINEKGSYRSKIIRYWRDKIFIPSQSKWWEKALKRILFLLGILWMLVPVLPIIVEVLWLESVIPVRSLWDLRVAVDSFLMETIMNINQALRQIGNYYLREISMWVLWRPISFGARLFIWVGIPYLILIKLPKKLLLKKYEKAISEAIANTHPYEIFDYASERKRCKLDIDKSITKICEKLGVDPEDIKVDFEKATGGGSTYIGWGSSSAVGAGCLLSLFSSAIASSKNEDINKRIRELESYYFYETVASFFNEKILPKLDVSAFLTEPTDSVDTMIAARYGTEASPNIDQKTRNKIKSYKKLAWTAFGFYAFFLTMLVLLAYSEFTTTTNSELLYFLLTFSALLLPVGIVLLIISAVKRKRYKVKSTEKSRLNKFMLLTLIPVIAPVFAVLSAINKQYSSLSKYIAWWIALTQIAFATMLILAA